MFFTKIDDAIFKGFAIKEDASKPIGKRKLSFIAKLTGLKDGRWEVGALDTL